MSKDITPADLIAHARTAARNASAPACLSAIRSSVLVGYLHDIL